MEHGRGELPATSVSLLSLPNELLLELLNEPGSLYLERHDEERQEKFNISQRDGWFTWYTDPCTRYTRPWSTEHHPIALPLSQTCRRLRQLMLDSVWAEVGLDSLEDLCKLRSGLRLLSERAELVVRLEWRWLRSMPAQVDPDYQRERPEIMELDFSFEPLELLLQPPRRWPKQPLTTEEECVEAMAEVICQLSSLDTLLWVSPYLPMGSRVFDFLSNKPVPLKALQVEMGGLSPEYGLETVKAPYWKLAGGLEKLGIRFRQVGSHTRWSQEEMARWNNYDDELSGLDDFVAQQIEMQEDARQAAAAAPLSDEEQNERLVKLTFSERQSVITYKTLVAACESNKLRSLVVEPHWTLRIPRLIPYWVKLEEVFTVFNARLEDCESMDWIRENAHHGMNYRWLDEANQSVEHDWNHYAEWYRGVAAIRPAIYHAARHRKEAGPLTVQDIQAIGEQGANYPASLFYPYFRNSFIAQGLLNEWEALVERGEGERVVCQCKECH